MAQVKPFKALRYSDSEAEHIDDFICPPYDVVSEDEYNRLLGRSDHNMIRLELPKGANPYHKAKELLEQWKKEGVLKRDQEDSFYIYEEEFRAKGNTYKLKGFIGRLKLSPFSQGEVVPHEQTLSKPKEDRFNLMKATLCNLSQIYCLYSDEKGKNSQLIESLSSKEPDVCVSDEAGITHRLWVVSDERACTAIVDNMEDKRLYIADGHHRYETALNFRDYCRRNGITKGRDAQEYVMAMFVDVENSGLVVFPTHRLLQNLRDFNQDNMLSKCEEYFDIRQVQDLSLAQVTLEERYKKGDKVIGVYFGGSGFTLLTLKDTGVMDRFLGDKSTASRQIDINVLHTLILENILGIGGDKLAKQTNLSYTRSFSEAINSVKKGESQCAFLMNPTSVEDIKNVSDAGEKMPQKSTYFYPKLITGLVINEMI